jgi:hypothetical protein
VARGRRTFKSEKRSKELKRLKKQEEKRQRRLGKATDSEEAPELFSPDEAPAAPPAAIKPDEQEPS